MQAWALLEQAAGNDFKARELFEVGSLADPTHIPIWQAWGVLEFKAGNIDRARALFQEVGRLSIWKQLFVVGILVCLLHFLSLSKVGK